MSAGLSPNDALKMIPELSGKKSHWQELPGGLTNRTFKVVTAEHEFVLRLDAKQTDIFGLDRDTELRARDQACKAGLAAQLLFSDIDRGIMLSEFLPGKVWSRDDLAEQNNLMTLAERIRTIHALPSLGTKFDALALAKRYAGSLAANDDRRTAAQQQVQQVSRLPVADSFSCCHNDVVAENVIAHQSLKFLDWEYACDNDPMFDLASVISYHNLNDNEADTLLSAYAGGSRPELRDQLEIQLQLYDAILWLWHTAGAAFVGAASCRDSV